MNIRKILKSLKNNYQGKEKFYSSLTKAKNINIFLRFGTNLKNEKDERL